MPQFFWRQATSAEATRTLGADNVDAATCAAIDSSFSIRTLDSVDAATSAEAVVDSSFSTRTLEADNVDAATCAAIVEPDIIFASQCHHLQVDFDIADTATATTSVESDTAAATTVQSYFVDAASASTPVKSEFVDAASTSTPAESNIVDAASATTTTTVPAAACNTGGADGNAPKTSSPGEQYDCKPTA